MSISNNYLQIKNIIIQKGVFENMEIKDDIIIIWYYNSCQPLKFPLSEPLTEEEKDDLLNAINVETISCKDLYEEENPVSEDNC